MRNSNNWEKCSDIIHRLSSRANNEQNQSVIVPSCIEKSFYQYKNDVGQGRCVEVCGTKSNEQFSNPIGPYHHQFTSSKIFDQKSEYMDYIVSNVLRQIVNHIPFNSLRQLSCSLPQTIETILSHTDLDSDRLIRILVTDALQCYGMNEGQLTDWYAFANLIKPFRASTKAKDDHTEEIDEKRNKILSKQENDSMHVLNKIPTATSVSPIVKKKQSSQTTPFNKIASIAPDTRIASNSRIPSTALTSQIISTTNSTTPMSVQSKESFKPVGTKYRSKTKSNQTSITAESGTVGQHQSLPFRQISVNRSSPSTSQIPHHIISDSRPHDYTSNKNTDQSSTSDCVLTIHHKYKHKRAHHRTTSFDASSSHLSVPIEESIQKDKQTSAGTSSIITNGKSIHVPSEQNISWNSINMEQPKVSHPFSTPSFQQSLYDATLLSSNKEQQISRLMNEVTMHKHSIVDGYQLAPLQDIEKSIASSNNDRIQTDTNSTPLKKRTTRINHYPNMLSDFD